MMDIHQTKRLWASLSPRLVKAASNRLPSKDVPNHKGGTDENQAGDRQRDHPVIDISYLSSDQPDNF